MPFQNIQFPEYPEQNVFLAYYTGIDTSTLTTVKSELVARNPLYDYCFLSTTHLVSMEQLRCAVYKSVENSVHGTMRAKTLNTEIIFNLSPINNINDALKRFGVDDLRSDVIVITVATDAFEEIDGKVSELLGVESLELNDQVLQSTLDVKKFKKLFKLADVDPKDYSQSAIAASLLRGL